MFLNKFWFIITKMKKIIQIYTQLFRKIKIMIFLKSKVHSKYHTF